MRYLVTTALLLSSVCLGTSARVERLRQSSSLLILRAVPPLEDPEGEVDINDCTEIVTERWPEGQATSPCVFWTSPADFDQAQSFIDSPQGLNKAGVSWSNIFSLAWADEAASFLDEEWEHWQPFAISSQAFAEMCSGTAYLIMPPEVDPTKPDRPGRTDASDSPFWNAIEFNTLTRNPQIKQIVTVPNNDFTVRKTIWDDETQGPYGDEANVFGHMLTVAEVRP